MLLPFFWVLEISVVQGVTRKYIERSRDSTVQVLIAQIQSPILNDLVPHVYLCDVHVSIAGKNNLASHVLLIHGCTIGSSLSENRPKKKKFRFCLSPFAQTSNEPKPPSSHSAGTWLLKIHHMSQSVEDSIPASGMRSRLSPSDTARGKEPLVGPFRQVRLFRGRRFWRNHSEVEL